ncbi:Pvc16 family protein [Kribbella ginsengisoli]|uniref:DUF4255 domain-containing protein n=1 Tax=Kribbella ginsengisoli TaxID=363865 RepID=A0ABP6WQ49_9ACTN
MLDEVEQAVGALLCEQLPAGTLLRTEPPCDTWSGELAGDDGPGCVGLFLHLVRESHADGAIRGWSEDRDDTGRVIRRTAAERRYDLCYLVTAWAASYERELNLLGGVLRAVAHHPTVPGELLAGTLADAEGPVTITIGRTGTPAAASEIWPALGVRPRTFLDLVVTAPVAPVVITEIAGPPDIIDLGVGSAAVGNNPADSPDRVPRRPMGRITEGSRDAAAGGQAG